jgi:hypothetical protein
MDFKEIKGQRHYLFDSKDEFYAISGEDAAVRRNWRDGSEGEWIFTDDEHVCQILKCFKVGKNDCVRTVCGTFSRKNKKNKMLGEEGIAEHIYSFSGKKIQPKDRELSERHFLFAKYIATGDDIIEAYKKAFPRSKSDDYVKRTASSLIKTENIKKMINEEIRAILDEEGVTPKYQIRSYKQVADLAEKDTDRLRALDSLSKISGLFDSNSKKTEELTVWAGFSPEQLHSIQNGSQLKDGKAKLLGKAEKKSEEV